MTSRIWYTTEGLLSSFSRYVFIADHVKDKSVLEIGCENGFGAAFLKRSGARTILGGDISADAIAYANEHFSQKDVTFLIIDAESIDAPDDSFDMVIAFEIIEHLDDPERFLKECVRVLKPKGSIVCSTPNRDYISPGFERPWFPGHTKEYTAKEFESLLGDYFNDIRLFGMGFGSAPPGLLTRLIFRKKPKWFDSIRPCTIMMINAISRIFTGNLRFRELNSLDEDDFNKMAKASYKSLPVNKVESSPDNLIIIAVKPANKL